jgi:hypothetical protein
VHFSCFLCLCCCPAIPSLQEAAAAVPLVSYIRALCLVYFRTLGCDFGLHGRLLDCTNSVFCAFLFMCGTGDLDLRFVRQPEFQVEELHLRKSWLLWCSELPEEGGSCTCVEKIGFVWQIRNSSYPHILHPYCVERHANICRASEICFWDCCELFLHSERALQRTTNRITEETTQQF